jgi:hypothetical protein
MKSRANKQALGASSETHAMSDTYLAHQHRLAEFRERLQYVEGACGLAVAVGGKVVALDLFNRADTCRKVWQRLLSGYVLDALEEDAETAHRMRRMSSSLLETVAAMPWQQSESVGEGEEYRANLGEALHASALTLGNAPVHVSVIVG